MAPRPILQDGPSDHGAASLAAQRRRPAPSHSPRHTNHARNLLPSHSLALRQFNSSDSFTSNDKNRPKGSFGFCRFCTIQDNDPRVVFSEGWLLRGTTFNTTHSTTQAGATASLRFKGRKIMVLGTVPVSNTTVKPPTVKYTISGQPPVQSTLPMANTEIRGQSFFHAMDIDEQEQTLTIEIVEAQSPFTLDSFFVTPHRNNNGDSDDDNDQDDSDIEPTANGMQFSSTLATITGTTPVTLPTADPYTDQTSFPAQNPTPTNLVPVLAGLVGGLVAVIVIGLVLFCIRRRRRRIRSAPEFWRNWYWRSSPRPETIYTHWTSTESIQRDEPSWLQRGSSAFTRSEGPPSDLRVSTIDQRFSLASPLPPLPTLLLKSPLPPLPTLSKSDL